MPVYFFDESDTPQAARAQRPIYAVAGLCMPYRALEEMEAAYWGFKRKKGKIHIQEIKRDTGADYDPTREMLTILAAHHPEILYCYGNKGGYEVRPESLRRKHLVEIVSWIAVNDSTMPLLLLDTRGRSLDNDDAEIIRSLDRAFPSRLPTHAHVDSARCIGLQFAHHVVSAVRKHYAGISSDAYRQIEGYVRMRLQVG